MVPLYNNGGTEWFTVVELCPNVCYMHTCGGVATTNAVVCSFDLLLRSDCVRQYRVVYMAGNNVVRVIAELLCLLFQSYDYCTVNAILYSLLDIMLTNY